jgi:hypothetical protein
MAYNGHIRFANDFIAALVEDIDGNPQGLQKIYKDAGIDLEIAIIENPNSPIDILLKLVQNDRFVRQHLNKRGAKLKTA